MVIPIVSPVIIDVIANITWLPVETADTSAAFPNCPTISKSTAPYIVCKNMAISMGMANFNNGENILPSVKLETLFISNLLFNYVFYKTIYVE